MIKFEVITTIYIEFYYYLTFALEKDEVRYHLKKLSHFLNHKFSLRLGYALMQW